MGDLLQLEWVRRHRHLAKPPILEIGARHYDPQTAVHYRSVFPECEYIGSDMSSGENVDVVCDFTRAWREIDLVFGGRRFKTAIACSVLEHVEDIYAFAANVSRIIPPQGVLFMSVPFVWRFHGYPSDFWRFTPRAIKFLFKDFTFADHLSELSSNYPASAMGVDTSNPQVVNQRAIVSKGLEGGPPYLLAPTMLSMVGFRNDPE